MASPDGRGGSWGTPEMRQEILEERYEHEAEAAERYREAKQARREKQRRPLVPAIVPSRRTMIPPAAAALRS